MLHVLIDSCIYRADRKRNKPAFRAASWCSPRIQRIRPHDLYLKVVGGGEEEPLFESGEPKYPKYWLKDGKSILFINLNGKSFYQLPLTREASRWC